jgi:hypothetical protein
MSEPAATAKPVIETAGLTKRFGGGRPFESAWPHSTKCDPEYEPHASVQVGESPG